MLTEDALGRSAGLAALALAAAEQAVRNGQFNLAKVLRATAHAHRALAHGLARERLGVLEPASLIEHALDSTRSLLAETMPVSTQPGAAASAAAILDKALVSLQDQPDVSERDVAQFLWGCHLCGYLAEGRRPDSCPVCGALAPDFEMFAPFYAQTSERLGRMSPHEILDTLFSSPAALEAEIRAATPAMLAARPAEGEWSLSELVAHIIETDLLFAARVHAVLAQNDASVDGQVMPWLLHVGKGYESLDAAALIDRFRNSRSASLALIQDLAPRDWARRANMRGSVATLLDFGTWIANHDTGHLQQVRRMVRQLRV